MKGSMWVHPFPSSRQQAEILLDREIRGKGEIAVNNHMREAAIGIDPSVHQSAYSLTFDPNSSQVSHFPTRRSYSSPPFRILTGNIHFDDHHTRSLTTIHSLPGDRRSRARLAHHSLYLTNATGQYTKTHSLESIQKEQNIFIFP